MDERYTHIVEIIYNDGMERDFYFAHSDGISTRHRAYARIEAEKSINPEEYSGFDDITASVVAIVQGHTKAVRQYET